MTDKHNKSFFGQSTAILIQSSSKRDPYLFLRCIKKNPDGMWEKPSKGEGKVIKCSLEEIVMILNLLNKRIDSWSTFHRYNEIETQISFSWDKTDANKLWINIGEYSKMLDVAQIEILKMLLEHILKEKIEFATNSGDFSNKTENNYSNSHDGTKSVETAKLNKNPKEERDFNNLEIVESIETSENVLNKKVDLQNPISQPSKDNLKHSQINAVIKRQTNKALLLELNKGNEVWIPKSGIKSKFIPEEGILQSFQVKKWILSKHNMSS